MFGVRMNRLPYTPVSRQPRSSATRTTMLGGVSGVLWADSGPAASAARTRSLRTRHRASTLPAVKAGHAVLAALLPHPLSGPAPGHGDGLSQLVGCKGLGHEAGDLDVGK